MEAFDLVFAGTTKRGELKAWLDQRAWDRGMEDIGAAVGELVLEEGEVKEETVDPGLGVLASPASSGGETSMQSVEEGEDLCMGWERLEGFLERGGVGSRLL